MNRHFSEEEICRWLAGERPAGWQQHLEHCEKCRHQTSLMTEVLAGFQGSVTARSAAGLAGYPMRRARSVRPAPFAARKLLAAAAVVCVLVLGLWLPGHLHRNGVIAPARPSIDSADADVALLERVSTSLSRTVPGPLEPLAAPLEPPRQATKESK